MRHSLGSWIDTTWLKYMENVCYIWNHIEAPLPNKINLQGEHFLVQPSGRMHISQIGSSFEFVKRLIQIAAGHIALTWHEVILKYKLTTYLICTSILQILIAREKLHCSNLKDEWSMVLSHFLSPCYYKIVCTCSDHKITVVSKTKNPQTNSSYVQTQQYHSCRHPTPGLQEHDVQHHTLKFHYEVNYTSSRAVITCLYWHIRRLHELTNIGGYLPAAWWHQQYHKPLLRAVFDHHKN